LPIIYQQYTTPSIINFADYQMDLEPWKIL